MTSEFTLEPTEKFFKENLYFKLDQSNVVMFEQRMIPAVSFDGKAILENKAKVAMAPGEGIRCVQSDLCSAGLAARNILSKYCLVFSLHIK